MDVKDEVEGMKVTIAAMRGDPAQLIEHLKIGKELTSHERDYLIAYLTPRVAYRPSKASSLKDSAEIFNIIVDYYELREREVKKHPAFKKIADSFHPPKSKNTIEKYIDEYERGVLKLHPIAHGALAYYEQEVFPSKPGS